MAKSTKLSLKLLIDEKKNKVVLAEADQDFVDVLISLLSLPMGHIARLLEKHKIEQSFVLGCYKNLNKSVANMGVEHFETEACKSMLLNPKSSKEIHCRKLKLNMDDTVATKFFVCPYFFEKGKSCSNVYTKFSTSRCNCGALMSFEISVPEEDQVGEVIGDSTDGVFVNCRSSFIVTDDLNVKLNSIGALMKVLKDQGYTGVNDLRETFLDVGFEEVVTLLGCLFNSENPLSCAYLKKLCLPKMLQMQSPSLSVQKTSGVESRAHNLKVYIRKSDRQIPYAECNEDFIDSLLSFLIYPLELACSFSNNDTIFGCVGNLCRSRCRRASASSFNKYPDYYHCSNNLFGFIPHPSTAYECLVVGSYWHSCKVARWIDKSLVSEGRKIVKLSPNNPKLRSLRHDTGFIKKDTKFIVSDDLVITPMSSSSTFSLLKSMQVDFSDLEVRWIKISRVELISILRASLNSTSALTNGLSNLLMKKPKKETSTQT